MAKEIKITIDTKNPTVSIGVRAKAVIGRDSSLDPSIHFKSTGSSGTKGDKGGKGDLGGSGADGTNGTDGVDGNNGNDGSDGTDGTNGTNGTDGINSPDLTISGEGTVHSDNYTDTVYDATTIQAEVDLNSAKTSNVVQETITGNAGTVTTNADLTGDVTSLGNATTMASAQTNINSILATDLVIGEDLQTCIDFGTPNNIKLKLNNTDEVTIAGNSVYPTSDNGIGLGTSSNGWSDLWLASGAVINWAGGAYISSFLNLLNVGYNTNGSDVKIYGATSGAHLFWDESADDLSAQGSATITATTVTTTTHFIHSGTYLNYSYSRYLPLNGSLNEQNTSTSAPEYTSFVWPYDGSVSKVWVRTEADSGSTEIKLYKGANGSSVSTAMGAITHDCDANTSVEFSMASVSNNFSKGEAMAIRIAPTNISEGVNVTIECVFNLTT